MRRFSLLLILVAWIRYTIAAEVPAEDPVPWTPPTKRPVLTSLPADSPQWAARKAAAFKANDDAVAEVAKFPEQGYSINVIPNESNVKKMPLKELDIITHFDGEPYEKERHHFKDGNPHKVKAYRYGQPPVEADIPAGPQGLFVYGSWYKRPEPVNLGDVPADPKWDDAIANFRKAFVYDHEFAEAELSRAIAAGLPHSPQTDAWFATLALNQMQYGRAMDFAWLSIENGMKGDDRFNTFIYAAMASGKLQALNDMLVRLKDVGVLPKITAKCCEIAAAMLNAYNALPKEQRAMASPSAAAAQLLRDDLTLRLEQKKGDQEFFDRIATTGELELRTITDHYSERCWGPSSSDIDLTLSFTIKDERPGPLNFLRMSRFSFLTERNSLAVSAGLGQQTWVDVGDFSCTAIFQFWPAMMTDESRVHTLRMVAVHGHSEIMLDGRRLAYTPLPPNSGPLFVNLHNCGVDLAVRSLHFSALLDEAAYKELMKSGVNAAFKGGQTRLHRAAEQGWLKEAGLLLDAGADPKIQDADGLTALHLAARNGHAEVLRLLLEKGGINDFSIAGALGDEKAIAALTEKPANGKDIGFSALHGAAAGNQVKLAATLIEGKANVNGVTVKTKETPLIWAARLGHKEMVALLLEKGADAALLDHRQRNAADAARWGGFDDLAKMLESAKPAEKVKPAVKKEL